MPLQASAMSDSQETDSENFAPKRRRVSVSSNDSYVGPAPLPALSRIKKNAVGDKDKAAGTEDPITSRDALDLGFQATNFTFASLDVARWLVGSLSAMAIRRPTAIQRTCIPAILKGRDCIGGSRTGSGKTVAFAVPILQKWAEDPFGIFAVVLTPTR
jgi:ATP-dependent RNA helicase DDX49/DBP8